jgi:bifunctional non-homologous end joining protein LigD
MVVGGESHVVRCDPPGSLAHRVQHRLATDRFLLDEQHQQDGGRLEGSGGRRRYTGPVAPPRLPTVTLMQPTLVAKPFHRQGLIFEEKVDGYRMVAYKADRSVKLVSRQGVDHTARYPDIMAALLTLEVPTLILDGEIAIFDKKLISRFEWLRHRQPPDAATPPLFMAFDCPYARGKDLRPRSLATRRNVLEDVLDGQDLVLPVRRLANDGLKAWAEVLECGFEGLVATRTKRHRTSAGARSSGSR